MLSLRLWYVTAAVQLTELSCKGIVSYTLGAASNNIIFVASVSQHNQKMAAKFILIVALVVIQFQR